MISEPDPPTDALLGKYLAGETNADETAKVQRWLAAAPAHRAEFERFRRLWLGAAAAGTVVDTDGAWNSVRAKLNRPAEVPVRPLRPARVPVWRIAATVTLLLGLGALAYRLTLLRPSSPAPQYLTARATNQPQRLVLPDGSRVTLNRNSQLRYPAAFTDSLRDVTLTGEAYFAVIPNATQPFEVQAQGTTVRVLGTEFGVRAYAAAVTVAVTDGRVLVSRRRQQVVLVRGDRAEVDTSLGTLRRYAGFRPNALAYHAGRLVFADTPLDDVVRQLGAFYGITVRLVNPALGTCRLTTRFTNESPEAALRIVAETLGLRLRRVGTDWLLEGDGCA